MKNLFLTVVIGATTISLMSCAAGPNAQTGAVLGGLAGAAAGGIIGHQSGRGLEGAAIGAGVGAVGGGVIGNAQDQRNAETRYYYENAPPPPPPRRPYRDPYYRGY